MKKFFRAVYEDIIDVIEFNVDDSMKDGRCDLFYEAQLYKLMKTYENYIEIAADEWALI